MNLIAKAQNKGSKAKIPIELDTAYLLDKTGWDYPTLRATPAHVIDELRLLWQVQGEARIADDRISKRKSKS